MYTLALYYMMKTPLEDNLLLHAFVNGDDAFRNSRFKLIPYISKVSKNSVCKSIYCRIIWPCFSHFALHAILFFSQGSWIVKQSVGKKACLVGQALNINYFRGENYLEVSCINNHVFSSNSSPSLSLSLWENYLEVSCINNHVFSSNSSLSLSLNALTSMVCNLLESFCNDVLWLVVMWWNANLTLCLKPAWNWCWVFDSGKGGGQSCSWIPEQFGHRNGILNTGKTTKLSQ